MLIKTIRAALAACLLVVAGLPAQAQMNLATSTLTAVKKRDQLVCGVNGELPGFSQQNAQKQWLGFDVEFCRAIAAAAIGDSTKVKFVPLSTAKRFEALRSGEIDVLVRNTTVTLERGAGSDMRYAAVTYIDGQRLVVPKRLAISRADQLGGSTICVLKGTTHEQNLDWFTARNLTVTMMPFETLAAMYEAFYLGRCTAVTQDSTSLAASIVASGRAAEYLMLPDIISNEPLGPFLRAGDQIWLDVVRWTHYAMLTAEEHGVTSANVDARKKASDDTAVRRLLGVVPGNGKALKLDEDWAYRIIKQVGNYGESFDRNFGSQSPLKFDRGINALWGKGGALYTLPMR